MNPILEKIIFLLAGGAAGAFITSFVMKPKYEERIDILEDEIEKYENHLDEEVEKTRKAVLEGLETNEKTNNKPIDKYDDDDEENEKLQKISRQIAGKVKQAKSKPDMKDILKDNGYQEEDDSDDDESEMNEVIDDETNSPYDDYDDIEVITGEEYGEYPDYDKEEFYYTRDKVLVDDQGNPIEDVDNIVGYDSLNQFGVYDDNVVYVRNHKLKTDISIFKDPNTLRNFKTA